jgi:ATP synthase protein I
MQGVSTPQVATQQRELKRGFHTVRDVKQPGSGFESLTDEDEPDGPVTPLSAEQAQALRARWGKAVSPWRLWLGQSGVMVLCGLVAWLVTGQFSVVLSALYGGLVVVLPNVLLVRGMTRGARTVVASALSFLFWEALKVGSSVAMLVLAPRAVPHLSWPALLISMVVCLKVSWVLLVCLHPRGDLRRVRTHQVLRPKK